MFTRHRKKTGSLARRWLVARMASLPVALLLASCGAGTVTTPPPPPAAGGLATGAPTGTAAVAPSPTANTVGSTAPTRAVGTPTTAVAPPAGAPTIGASTATAAGTPTGAAHFPDIVRVMATRNADGNYDFEVTVSSPYDTPERYADGWHLLTPEGQELAAHRLTHDQQREQPFARTQSAVPIPAGIDRVLVEGHDQRSGYGGKQVAVALPARRSAVLVRVLPALPEIG